MRNAFGPVMAYVPLKTGQRIGRFDSTAIVQEPSAPSVNVESPTFSSIVALSV
jgi:hypothetical protein